MTGLTPPPLSGSHPGPGHPGQTVERVPVARRAAALACLLASHGRTASAADIGRFEQHARTHGASIDRLIGLRDPDTPGYAASVLVVPTPGRTALLFLSESVASLEAAPANALLHEAVACAQETDVGLVQILIDPNRADLTAVCARAGFDRLASLTSMERPLNRMRVPQAPAWPDGLAVRPFDPASGRALLEDLLAATYEATLDCPGLHALRSVPDILDGHLASGIVDPGLWHILEQDGDAVGCCLLSIARSLDVIELVYMGLAVPARGAGLGRRLLAHALRSVAHRRERIMTLAVDDANAPAVALYRRAGFRAVARRLAFVHPLPTS